MSHQSFDKMFSDTYGILYDRHSSIFNDMFRDLELYYTTGSVDLTVAMKQFFSLLYKKMFEELNSQYAFDGAYLNCTVEHMEEMMPFGELPRKLILQIKRSFIAVRTFVQALNYGNEVLRTIMEVYGEWRVQAFMIIMVANQFFCLIGAFHQFVRESSSLNFVLSQLWEQS